MNKLGLVVASVLLVYQVVSLVKLETTISREKREEKIRRTIVDNVRYNDGNDVNIIREAIKKFSNNGLVAAYQLYQFRYENDPRWIETIRTIYYEICNRGISGYKLYC